VNATTGELATILEFGGEGSSNRGSKPLAGLASVGAGLFLGTTFSGGAHGNGTVFRVEQSTGNLTTLLEFNDADAPFSASSMTGRDFFGVRRKLGGRGYGTIFKLNENTGK
jgi:uncharacterized repeat protein (TIGR03803 family)